MPRTTASRGTDGGGEERGRNRATRQPEDNTQREEREIGGGKREANQEGRRDGHTGNMTTNADNKADTIYRMYVHV